MATSVLGLSLNFNGIVRLRQSLKAAFEAFDSLFAPLIVTSAATSITLTAAAHFTNSAGFEATEATLYTTSATAVAAAMTKTESDKLAIGTRLNLVQSAGAVTITGSGGVTFTARGVVAGGRTAVAHKVSAALWLVDYPALSA